MHSLQEAREVILEMDGTIIHNQEKDGGSFYYMLRGGFGYVQGGNLSGCLHVSSEYKPHSSMGTGSVYTEKINYSKEDFINATHHLIKPNSAIIEWYADLDDFLANNFFAFDLAITTKEGTKTILEYGDGYYVFNANCIRPVLHKSLRHINLQFMNNKNYDFQAVFKIKDSDIEVVSTNFDVNVHADELEKLKSDIVK